MLRMLRHAAKSNAPAAWRKRRHLRVSRSARSPNPRQESRPDGNETLSYLAAISRQADMGNRREKARSVTFGTVPSRKRCYEIPMSILKGFRMSAVDNASRPIAHASEARGAVADRGTDGGVKAGISDLDKPPQPVSRVIGKTRQLSPEQAAKDATRKVSTFEEAKLTLESKKHDIYSSNAPTDQISAEIDNLEKSLANAKIEAVDAATKNLAAQLDLEKRLNASDPAHRVEHHQKVFDAECLQRKATETPRGLAETADDAVDQILGQLRESPGDAKAWETLKDAAEAAEKAWDRARSDALVHGSPTDVEIVQLRYDAAVAQKKKVDDLLLKYSTAVVQP
jgi:hypothetical protein